MTFDLVMIPATVGTLMILTDNSHMSTSSFTDSSVSSGLVKKKTFENTQFIV